MEDWQKKLEANLTETGRQLGFLGVRFGVIARLNELRRDRKRIAKKLIQIDPNADEADYGIHLHD